MSTTTRWWWIRHAPVDSGGRIYGQRDLPADCSDTRTFRWLADLLPAEAVWLVTPLKRTHQTAGAIRAHWPGDETASPAPPDVEPDFIEQHFGDWQGRSYQELDRLREGVWHRFWLAPAETRAPGGESFAEVMTRVGAAVRRHSESFPGRDIVTVAHGGSIRAAVAQALGLQPDKALSLTVDNCSLTRIDHIAGAPGSHDHQGRESWRVGKLNLSLRELP